MAQLQSFLPTTHLQLTHALSRSAGQPKSHVLDSNFLTEASGRLGKALSELITCKPRVGRVFS